MQIERHRNALASAQHRLTSQQRLIEDLQREVDMLRADRRKVHRRNVELAARVEQAELDAREAAAHDGHDDPKGGLPGPDGGPHGCGGPELGSGVPGWALHAVVALAAVALRWWLANETDAVQRKIALVIIWPGIWAYASMWLGCLPAHSPALRRLFLCLSLLICGYVARAAVERTLSTPSGGGAGQALGHHWPQATDWAAFVGQHLREHNILRNHAPRAHAAPDAAAPAMMR